MPMQKFKALVHFMIYECRDHPSRLGATRLNKALWFADVISYKINGASITGERYVKRQNGPVPADILRVLRELVDQQKLAITEPEAPYEPRIFTALKAPKLGSLSEQEKSLSKNILEAVCGFAANEISEHTHDIVWEAAALGEEIPLYATLAANEGVIDDDARQWAKKIVSAQA